jgi:uncharacterized lipoprotein YddW (UPF0748 family)
VKHRLLFFIKTIFFFLFCTTLFAQPKQEFRAMWIANVANVDWPSAKNLPAEQQRAELVAYLDMAQRQGLNAVFFQIRNACDAVYQSNLEPWSEWLTGTQGQSPGYDPLAFIIQECRKRNIELHAWMNPYRAVTDTRSASIASTHLSRTHPEAILSYGTLRILDPGLPEVRAWVARVVMDVVRRYDVDGIHFDDYFYPYPQTGLTLNDNATFNNHNRGITNRADWRRDNVNLLIKAVSDSVRRAKPWVKFGVSPFGIWQNRSSSSLGSDTRGFEGYSGVYADARTWAQEGWVDYVLPQIYWSIGNSAANFSVLVPWWNQNSFGKHFYVGHGAYKINEDADANWRKPQEIGDQIRLLRTYPNAKGSTFFSAKTLRNNPLGLGDSLEKRLYTTPALIPAMPWKDMTPPPPPQRLTAKLNEDGSSTIAWEYASTANSELDKARYFVVYRGSTRQALDTKSSRSIWAIVPKNDNTTTFSLIDRGIEAGLQYSYAISAVDRLHNESTPTPVISPSVLTSTMATVTTPEKKVETAVAEPTLAQTSTEGIDLQAYPNPFNQTVNLRYRLSEATDVSLLVYDARGTRVGVLIDARKQEAGNHSVQFNGQFLSEGTYFARLTTGRTQKTVKMILSR